MMYDAIVTHEGKHFLVQFPDCPGCQTFADSEDVLLPAAQEALEGWLEAHLVSGQVPTGPGAAKRPANGTRISVPVGAQLAAVMQLRWARHERRLSQAAVARLAKVSQQQIAKLEDPDANPTLGTLERVARALGLRMALTFDAPGLEAQARTPRPRMVATRFAGTVSREPASAAPHAAAPSAAPSSAGRSVRARARRANAGAPPRG